MDLNALISFLAFPSLPFNALDVVVIGVILFYVYEGYIVGFILSLLDLLSFIFSFLLALFLYKPISVIFISLFSMPQGFSSALAFFCIALVSEILLNILLKMLIARVAFLTTPSGSFKRFASANNYLGIIPGLISAVIVLSFLFSVIIALPSSPALKELVSGSKTGSILIANTAFVEGKINEVFGGALKDTLTYLTIEPESNELVTLGYTVQTPVIDERSEDEMLDAVNWERESRGLPPLHLDESLTSLARDYSADMFRRGYFSHYTPDDPPLSPFDRMEQANIIFLNAGENLALAPTTKFAMQGLMNSPGHKANILSKEFNKIGIGVMDGGIYGKMFTQEFSN